MNFLKFASDLSGYLEEISEDANEAVIEFPVFREGKFEHPWHDTLVFDTYYLEKLIENHRSQAFHAKVSLDVSHRPQDGAYGWVEDVNNGLFLKEMPVKTPNGQKLVKMLFARFTLNKLGIEAVKNKVFRYCSAEINTNYTNYEVIRNSDGRDQIKNWGPTLVGVALTNRPFINGLGEVSLSSESVPHEDPNKMYLSCSVGPGLIFAEVGKLEQKNNELEAGSRLFESAANSTSEEVGSVTETIGESKMKFTELVKNLKSFSTVEQQVEHLKASRHLLPEGDAETFDALLAAKEEAVHAKVMLSEAAHRKKMAEDAAEQLRLQNTNLSLELSEAKEGSWAYRVEAYCEKLRAEDHYEAVVNKAKEILSSMSPANRDYKFSVGCSEKPLDVINILSEVLDCLPSEARMNFSELSSANEEFEVSPDVTSFSQPTEVESSKPSHTESKEESDIPEKVLKYFKLHSHYPPESIWSKIEENGMLNLDRVDPKK